MSSMNTRPYASLIDFNDEKESTNLQVEVADQFGSFTDPFAILNTSRLSPIETSSSDQSFNGPSPGMQYHTTALLQAKSDMFNSYGDIYGNLELFGNVTPHVSTTFSSPSSLSSSPQVDLLSSIDMPMFPTIRSPADMSTISAQDSCTNNETSFPCTPISNVWSFEDMSSVLLETPPEVSHGDRRKPSPHDSGSLTRIGSTSAMESSFGASHSMSGDLGCPSVGSMDHSQDFSSSVFQPAKDEPLVFQDFNDGGDLDVQRVSTIDSIRRVSNPNDRAASQSNKMEQVSDNDSVSCSCSNLVRSMAHSTDFIGSGGGKGIFKAPERGVGRRVPLELRPQPLDNTLVSRVLECTDTTLWAGGDVGIMVWCIPSACGSNCDGKINLDGDKDASGYCLLQPPGLGTTCMCLYIGKRIMWSGHKDGRVQAWDIKLAQRSEARPILGWQAHQTSVLAMVVTSYGELWTGSNNGSLRAWPCDAIRHALSAVNDSASIMEASYIDLRTRGAAAGAPNLSTVDVQFLFSEHSMCRAWSGGPYLLALWDERTRDILKVFGPNADMEFVSPNISPVREGMRPQEVKVNLTAKALRNEKSQGSLNFFQRSRNAVMGAADAVLRATVGIQTVNENKKMEAIVAAADGNVWGGFADGHLIRWDCYGNHVSAVHHSAAAVKCICAFGNLIFVGYSDGIVHSLALESGRVLESWHVNKGGVAKLGVCQDHLFTLAENGAIRGWHIASQSSFDVALHMRMISRESSYVRFETLKLLTGTWNVGQEKASFKSLVAWLGKSARQVDIVVVGLQEVEMGAGILAMAAAKETVGLPGSVNGQWWLDNISAVLNGKTFECIASRQLAGLLIGAWVRKDLLPFVGGVDVGAVACGFGRAFGNKGAVAVKMMVFRRLLCVVNCHLAAHMDAVVKRNADFEHIYTRMAFGQSYGGVGVVATNMAASAVQILRGSSGRQDEILESQDVIGEQTSASRGAKSSCEVDATLPELADSDILVWMGDLNYRLDELSYASAIDLIAKRRWDDLLKKDQLRSEMRAGRVFQGMREASISFPPTYKFDKGTTEPEASYLGYDSSENRRVPAWCDRVLFRDSFDENDTLREASLFHPVLAAVDWYGACLETLESDHKPVTCVFHVDVAVINEAARRWEYGRFLHADPEALSVQKQLNFLPEIDVSARKLVLVDWKMSPLCLTNKNTSNIVLFSFSCGMENDMQCSDSGFPIWLQVIPASGVLLPGQAFEVCVQYAGRDTMVEDGLSWGREKYQRNLKQRNCITLVLQVKGILSSCCQDYYVSVSHHLSNNGA